MMIRNTINGLIMIMCFSFADLNIECDSILYGYFKKMFFVLIIYYLRIDKSMNLHS